MDTKGWSWVLPFLLLEGKAINEVLIKSKQVISYLNNLSIVKKNRMLCFISRWILCLSPCSKHKGFFSEIHCENFVDIHEVKLKEWETLWWLGSSGVFNNQNCPHWASRNLAIQLDFPSWTLLPTDCSG